MFAASAPIVQSLSFDVHAPDADTSGHVLGAEAPPSPTHMTRSRSTALLSFAPALLSRHRERNPMRRISALFIAASIGIGMTLVSAAPASAKSRVNTVHI